MDHLGVSCSVEASSEVATCQGTDIWASGPMHLRTFCDQEATGSSFSDIWLVHSAVV